MPTVPNPVVRYMILCDDFRIDPNNPRRISIDGVLSIIRSMEQPPYPLLYQELCVLLVLTEGRGTGEGQIRCVFEETGQKIFESDRRPITFGADPLDVVGVRFRIRACPFPRAGLYQVQFW